MPITIVTAFFDIGRGQWNSRQGGNQPFLKRTTDTYFRRFAHLASLDNEMVVFTSPDLVDRVRRLRKGRPDREPELVAGEQPCHRQADHDPDQHFGREPQAMLDWFNGHMS